MRCQLKRTTNKVIQSLQAIVSKTDMSAPRDGQTLLKYITEKKAEIESSRDPEMTYDLVCELEALEWLYKAVQPSATSKSED